MKKPSLKVRVTKAWYVEVVDENDRAIRDDWCFGTHKEAEALGAQMLKTVESVQFSEEDKRELQTFLPEQEVDTAACIFWAVNSIGGGNT